MGDNVIQYKQTNTYFIILSGIQVNLKIRLGCLMCIILKTCLLSGLNFNQDSRGSTRFLGANENNL